MRRDVGLGGIACALTLAVSLAAMARAPLLAGDGDGGVGPHWEIGSGVDGTASSGFSYASITFAPFGSSLETGLRLRASGGSGLYGYDGNLPGEDGERRARILGRTGLGAALIGYQIRRGRTIAKAFIGVQASAHTLSPADEQNPVSGEAVGAMLAFESWTDLNRRVALSLDAQWTSAFSSYWVRGRVERRVLDRLAIGIELGGLGNAAYRAGRAGLFLRYRADFAEISLSGGLSGDYDAPSVPYGGINMFRRF